MSVLAVAHRGGAGLAPENTVTAFRRSLALGLSYLETDVRVTADGVCVAFHDRTLRRVTGVAGSVADLTWSELRTLPVLDAERVPRLDDLLTRWPGVRWLLDVKQPAQVGRLVDVVRDVGAAGRVTLAGTWDATLHDACSRVGDDVSRTLGWGSVARLVRGSVLDPRGARAVCLPRRLAGRRVATPALVERAHRYGLRVLVWGVDEPAEMHRLLDDGVDGVITDRPDLLREVLVARDAWRPGVLEPH
ncbi:MAG: glycerophosphodiester phosphodiesterase family protein [Actinomycetes bacterium]